MNLIDKIANEYNIPVVTDQTKVWYFSTKSGQYYDEFVEDKFIGLGWNELQGELFTDSNRTEQEKRRIIKECYPEKKTGVIMNQMEAFYNEMKAGDYVVIPSEGSNVISTGCVGEIKTDYNGKFAHKRSINWANVDATNRDIYLLKELRAQQNVSELSESGELIYRNMFPVYIADDGIHITLQKVSSDDFQLLQSLELENTFMQFFRTVGALYGNDNFTNEIRKKTAVGSPGFVEYILSHTPEAIISVAAFLYIMIGKRKGPDGSTSTGLIAVFEEISSFLDRKAVRNLNKAQEKKTLAEEDVLKDQAQADINLKNAQAQKTQVEADVMKEQSQADTYLKRSQVLKNLAETDVLNAQAREINSRIDSNNSDVQTAAEIDTENESILLPDPNDHIDEINAINEIGEKLKETIEKSGLKFISNDKGEDEIVTRGRSVDDNLEK